MMVDRDRVCELLEYSPETGVFRWKVSRTGKAKAGSIAGSKDRDGYIEIKIDRRLYRAHRLAWLVMTGKWPTIGLDHINRDRSDNRFLNLMEATNSENCRNKISSQNTSGFKGVYRDGRRWRAQITLHGNQRCLGSFDDPETAHRSYCEAAKRLHGDFARVS